MKRVFAAVSIMALAGSVLFGGGQVELAEPTDRLIAALEPPQLEGFQHWTTPGNWGYMNPAMEGLVGQNPETGAYDNSRLAESWEHSADFTVWTFRLKDGVQFHHGWGEVTAHDVVHSVTLQTGPAATIPGTQNFRDAQIEALDDYTVRFVLREPFRDFLFSVADRTIFYVFSKAQYEAEGIAGYDAQPAGTGQFMYSDSAPGWILYERVENHYSGITPEFRELEMRFPAEVSTRLSMIQAGDVHIAQLSRDLAGTAISAGLEIIQSTTPQMQTQVVMNGLYLSSEEDPDIRERAMKVPWADIRIREALNRAINRHEALEVLMDGRGELLPVFAMHPNGEGYDAQLVQRFEAEYGYDPGRARELLKEAGYPDAFEDPTIPLAASVLRGMEELHVQPELLYEFFTDVGFHVEIIEMDHAQVTQAGRERRSFMLHPNRNAPLRPTTAAFNAFYDRPGGPNQGFETDAMLERTRKFRVETDPVRRDEIAREQFNYMFEQYQTIPMFEVFFEMVVNPNIVESWVFPGSAPHGNAYWYNIKLAR